MLNIYEKAIEILSPKDIDHHCSDLYLRKTRQSEKLINDYEYRSQVSVFTSNIDNRLWYEIPFAYTPYWERRQQ